MKFEIFITKPIKVEVEATSYEQAIEIIKKQLNAVDLECVEFSQAIEVEEDNGNN